MPKKTIKKGDGPKRGFLSEKEKTFVEKYMDRLTPEQIANRMNRPVSTIQNFINNKGDIKGRAELTIASELETRPEWAQWKDQFSAKELEFFKYRYVQLMAQFQDDLQQTDEIQLFNLITIEILMQRVLKEQKPATVELDFINAELENLYDDLRESPDDESLKGQLREREARRAELQSSLKAIGQRYDSYMMRQSSMMKELKATRDQRTNINQNSKVSILAFLRALQDPEFRDKQSEEMEKYRLAMEKQREKMILPHVFIDGVEDRPLMTPEVVASLKDDGDDS